MNHAAGVRVLVHDQNAMPFPEDSAISVPTGQETFIGVNRVCFTFYLTCCGLTCPCSKLFHDQNAMLFPEDSEINVLIKRDS